MESLEMIKKRIQSIDSTRQITRSMRLVSTTRVYKSRLRMEANAHFQAESERLMGIAAADCPDDKHPYISNAGEECAAVIVISGDRGLCGGYNINANRHAAAFIKAHNGNVKIITVGAKSRDYCRRRYKGKLIHSFIDISDNASHEDAAEIASIVKNLYDSGAVGQIFIVYTKYESMLVQLPAEKKLLPFDIAAQEECAGGSFKAITRCDPAGAGFLSGAAEFYISACVLSAILESALCEHCARVTSMDSAVKNADEMIDSLTLQYNQARQDAITQEIVEIVGGADAV